MNVIVYRIGRRGYLSSEPTTQFEQDVVRAVHRIPSGRVASYAQVAEMAGYSRGSQLAVDICISKGPRGPIWRVVREDGTWVINRYDGSSAWGDVLDSRGFNEQQRTLWDEGVDIEAVPATTKGKRLTVKRVPKEAYLTDA